MGSVDFDFSDIDGFFETGNEEIRLVVKEVGEYAVDYAEQNGTYQNRTGRLRKANKANPASDGLELTNEMEYASYVESKGFEVLSSAALEAEKQLRDRIL